MYNNFQDFLNNTDLTKMVVQKADNPKISYFDRCLITLYEFETSVESAPSPSDLMLYMCKKNEVDYEDVKKQRNVLFSTKVVRDVNTGSVVVTEKMYPKVVEYIQELLNQE